MDAQYFMVRNTLGIMKWVNDELVKCVQWQDLPEIQHPEVKLSGEVDIFYPTWAEKHTIPNHASYQELVEKCK